MSRYFGKFRANDGGGVRSNTQSTFVIRSFTKEEKKRERTNERTQAGTSLVQMCY